MNKQILRLAIPNILSNLSIPLLSSVDTALVGHLDQSYYLGAIAIGGMIFNFIYWGLGFLRMGTTGLTAQSFGAGNPVYAMLVFYRAMLVAGIGSVLLILLQNPILYFSFLLIDATPEVQHYATLYFQIRIWAAPATLAMYGIQGWMLGMQNARDPMIITITINLVNIFFSVLFVRHYGMTADGVALGTVIANYFGLLLSIAILYLRYRRHFFRFKLSEVLEIAGITRFFKVNRDIMIRTLCLIFAFSFFTAQSAAMGDDILAANSILLQLWAILAYGIDGFAYAAESLAGKYSGAKDESGFRKTIRYIFGWAAGLAAVLSVIYIFGAELILSLFTDNQEVIALALSVYFWTAIAPLVNSFCFVWDGIFLGATETRPMRNTMIFATCLIFLPAYYISTPILGVHGLWLSMCLFMVVRGVSLWYYAPRVLYNNFSKSSM